jgi:5'-methylthioadenosine phosphorylase
MVSASYKRTVRTLGVIGGSGLSQIPGLHVLGARTLATPYGAPSAPIVEAHLGDARVLFMPRHGIKHRIPPHQVNYRANICALKLAGAEQVLSISAVGSMKEEIAPGDVVVVDQFIDFTKRRASTYFDTGLVAHVGFADPVCPNLSRAASDAAREAGARVHRGGTYVCIEGPQFSTRAESRLYRSMGASVIGMTALPEAKLAREAQLPYATLALATDYDSWHETEQSVSVDAVLKVLRKNVALAQKTVENIVSQLPDPQESSASRALQNAVLTQADDADPEVRASLTWLLG